MLTTPPSKKPRKKKPAAEKSREPKPDLPVVESDADFDRVLGGVLSVPARKKRRE